MAAGLRGLDRIADSAAKAWQNTARSMQAAANAATKAAAAMRGAAASGMAAGSEGGMGVGAARGGPPLMLGYDPHGELPAVIPNSGRYGEDVYGPSAAPSGWAIPPYAAAGTDGEPARAGAAGSLAPIYGGTSGGGEPPDEPFQNRERKNKGNGGSPWFPGMGEVIAGIAGYDTFKTAGNADVAGRQALLNMGYKDGTPEFELGLAQLRMLSSDASKGTIYSMAQTEEVMPVAAAILGWGANTPDGRKKAFEEFMQVFRPALNFAEAAQKAGLGDNLDASMASAIEFAHMEGRYDPKDLQPALDRLLNVSRLTHTPINDELRAMSYVLPAAQATGANLDDVVALTGYLQQQGLTGTKAGLALNQMISSLTPSAVQRLSSAHAVEMRALGLTDKHGRLAKDVAPGGKLSIEAVLKHLEDYERTHTPVEVAAALRTIFNIRGARAASLLSNPDALAKIERFMGQLNTLPTATETQQALANSPYQQFEQMLARINDTGNILVTSTLPGLKVAFESITRAIGSFNQYLQGHPKMAEGAGYGLEAAAAYIGYKIIRGMSRFLFGGGVKSAISEAAEALSKASGGAASDVVKVAEAIATAGTDAGTAALAIGRLAGAFGPLMAALYVMKPTPTATEGQEHKAMGTYFIPGKGLVDAKEWNAAHPGSPTVLPPSGSGSQPVHITGGHSAVTVANPGDIKHGVTSGIIHDSHGPQTGPTGSDIRIDPWAGAFQAAVP